MKLTLIFAITISLLSGCNQSENDTKPEKKELELKSKEVLEATDRFGWELLQTVNQEADPGQNVVISSLSVAQALGMTTNGAANETLSQMLDVMDFGEVSEMNEAFQNIREVLQTADPKVQVDIANSVWYRQGMPAKESFGEALEQYYDAAFREVDFSRQQEAKDLINGWVNDKTRGKIPSIVDEISANQYMFLINAVYFLGKWQYEFDKSATKDEDFTLSDGSTIQVPMMNQETDLDFYSGEDCQAVKLPYGDGSFYMMIALPNDDLELDGFINSMDTNKWSAITGNMQERGIALFMPRFEVECKFKLNDALINMGMELPFMDGAADFSNMIDGQVVIDKVMHKTYIKADEEGTEAAAVTSVSVVVTSVGGGGPMQFRVDRPFFFAIAEEESDAILFSGKIENPKQ